jgi:hypothetical protein
MAAGLGLGALQDDAESAGLYVALLADPALPVDRRPRRSGRLHQETEPTSRIGCGHGIAAGNRQVGERLVIEMPGNSTEVETMRIPPPDLSSRWIQWINQTIARIPR